MEADVAYGVVNIVDTFWSVFLRKAVAHGAECGVKPCWREHCRRCRICEWKGQTMLGEEWAQALGRNFKRSGR